MGLLLLIVLIVVIFAGGGGYYVHRSYGAPGLGGLLALVLVGLVMVCLFGR